MEELHVYLRRNIQHNSHWKVCKINNVEQPKWQQTLGYESLESFYKEEMNKNKWKGAAVDYGDDDAFISFRR